MVVLAFVNTPAVSYLLTRTAKLPSATTSLQVKPGRAASPFSTVVRSFIHHSVKTMTLSCLSVTMSVTAGPEMEPKTTRIVPGTEGLEKMP